MHYLQIKAQKIILSLFIMTCTTVYSSFSTMTKLFPALLLLFSSLFILRLILLKTGLIFTFKKYYTSFEDFFHVYQFIKVPQFNTNKYQQNQLYYKVHAYLTNLASTQDSDFINLFTGKNSNDVLIDLDPEKNIVVDDNFLGARVYWISKENQHGRCFMLKIRKSDKKRILRSYLQHIHDIHDECESRKRDIKLYVNSIKEENAWLCIPFKHAATFETIVMQDDLKAKIKSDLDLFVKSRQYYAKLGRVWKRSFLLYGPSGTGKSSFIAAMANHLNYDVYEINLSRMRDDAELRSLLLQMTRKSVLVVEDLDRVMSANPVGMSFSGVLNFMDGVFNACVAEERIMVFTMNSKDGVDPDLLRPGRVDVHIYFPLCDFNAFKVMASNYLGLKDHKLFPAVEEIFSAGSSLSPAEIGELMIANRSSPSRAIKSVICALQSDGEGRERFSESGSRRMVEDVGEADSILGRYGTPVSKEIKKLYGIVSMRKTSRKTMSLDLSSEQNVI